jgi:hypothetical protein
MQRYARQLDDGADINDSGLDMAISQLLNEDAVALAIASIPTRPPLSTNDTRLFLFSL